MKKIYKLIHPSNVVFIAKEAIESLIETTEEPSVILPWRESPVAAAPAAPRKTSLRAESLAAQSTDVISVKSLHSDKEAEIYSALKQSKIAERRDLLEFEESFLRRWQDIISGFVEVLQSGEFPDKIEKYPAIKKAGEIIKDLQGDRKDEYNRESLLSMQSYISGNVMQIQNRFKKYPTAKAVEPLIASLKGEDDYLREQAAEALGQIKDRKAVELLVASLKDGDATTRCGVTYALGQIKDPKAVEPLVAALKDGDISVRIETIRALGNIKDPKAVETLIASLEDENAFVRIEAAQALGRIEDIKALEPLKSRLEKESDSIARNAIEQALKELEG